MATEEPICVSFFGERWVIEERLDEAIALLVAEGGDADVFHDVARLEDHASTIENARAEAVSLIGGAERVDRVDVWGPEVRHVAPLDHAETFFARRGRNLGLGDDRQLDEGDVFWVLVHQSARDPRSAMLPQFGTEHGAEEWWGSQIGEAEAPRALDEMGWEFAFYLYGNASIVVDVTSIARREVQAAYEQLMRGPQRETVNG